MRNGFDGRSRKLGAGALMTGLSIAALALTGTGSSLAAPEQRSPRARTIPASVPALARDAAPVAAAHGRVDFALVLPLRDAAGLEAFNRAASDPASASYGVYLSPPEFRDRFAPSEADQDSARDWLRAAGFRPTESTESGALIGATGSTARVERVFRTQLGRFRSAGETVTAPADPITLPAALDGVAVDVSGLAAAPAEPAIAGNELAERPAPAAGPNDTGDDPAPPTPLFRNAGPCSRYYGELTASGQPRAYGDKQPFAPCGYGPNQLQGAYGIDSAIGSGNDGAGETVTILDAFASPTLERDAQRYASSKGQPPLDYEQTVFTGCRQGCNDRNKQGWYGEQTLDVEAAHAMAPGATVHYVGARDNYQGLTVALAYIVDNADDLDTSIVSNSYGYLTERLGSGNLRAQEQIFEQAVAEGVGLYFSSGDSGDAKAELGYETAAFPPSSPNVIAVGGTSLGVGPLNDHTFEIGWGTYSAAKQGGRWAPKPPGDFFYGAGGGVSRVFAQPGYQRGVVPERIASRYDGAGRAVPDISAVGDPNTGMLVGQTQTAPSGRRVYDTYRIGGTSLSSPLFAGFMALADQRAGFDHGFANPAFYDLAGDGAFRDVLPVKGHSALVRRDFVNGANAKDGASYSLRTGGMDSSLQVRRGWDEVTGIGTPIGEPTLDALAGSD